MRFAPFLSVALAVFSSSAQALRCSLEIAVVAIGPYSAVTAAIERMETIQVRCVVDAAPIPAGGAAFVSVALGAGNGSSYIPYRNLPDAMPTAATGLKYNFYLPPSYQQAWGDTGTDQLTFSLTGLNAINASAVATRNVMLRVPTGQWGVSPGAYSDNLVVTLTF